MAILNKKQVWANVQEQVSELLEGSKVSKKFKEELMLLLESNIAPKAGGGSSINPVILNEDGTIKEAYCRFHKRYEAIEDMVVSASKPRGYCKASISLWNKTNSTIKKLESKAVKAVNNGDFESAQSIAIEVEELKANLNSPEFYDYDRDWSVFNG